MPLTHWANLRPDFPATIMAETGEAVSFAQLEARSNRGAHLFRHLGLATGDRIALMVDNQALFFELCWAAHRSGLAYTPISTHLTVEGVAYILEGCDAKVAVASSRCSDAASVAVKRVPFRAQFFVAGATSAGFSSWETAAERFPSTRLLIRRLG